MSFKGENINGYEPADRHWDPQRCFKVGPSCPPCRLRRSRKLGCMCMIGLFISSTQDLQRAASGSRLVLAHSFGHEGRAASLFAASNQGLVCRLCRLPLCVHHPGFKCCTFCTWVPQHSSLPVLVCHVSFPQCFLVRQLPPLGSRCRAHLRDARAPRRGLVEADNGLCVSSGLFEALGLLWEESFVGFPVNGANLTIFRNALGPAVRLRQLRIWLVSREFFGNASPSSAEMDQCPEG